MGEVYYILETMVQVEGATAADLLSSADSRRREQLQKCQRRRNVGSVVKL